METARCIPPNSANPLGPKARGNAEPIQPATRLAGVESGRRGPKRFRKNSHGRGAFQTPNADVSGGESRSGYENPLAARSCRFDPGSGHQTITAVRASTGEPFRRRHAPDVQRCTAAAQSVLGQVQDGDGADVEFVLTFIDFQCRRDGA
jgi:hypothetical protein